MSIIVPRLTGPRVASTGLRAPRIPYTPDTRLQQAGNVLNQVADQQAQIIQREQLEADSAASLEATNQLSQWKATALYSENGALARQGKNALNVTAEVMPEFEKQMERLSSSATSRRQKAYISQLRIEQGSAIRLELERHATGQLQQYKFDQEQAFLKNSRDDATLHANDPAYVETETAKQAQVIGQRARRLGWSEDELQSTLRANRVAQHTGILSAFVEGKQASKAAAYLSRVESDLDPETTARARNAIEGLQVDNTADRLRAVYLKQGPDAGNAALQSTLRGASPDIQGRILGKVNESLSQIRAIQQQAHAKDLAEIRVALDNNSVDPQMQQRIDDLYRNNVFTPFEYASWTAQRNQAFVQGSAQLAASQAMDEAMASGLPLDPKNPKQREVLDARFAMSAQGSKVGSQDWQDAASAFAQQYRILPERALAWVRQSLRSPNPRTLAEAAQFVGAIEAASPDALSGLDEDTKATAMAMSDLMLSGADPEKAAQLIRQNLLETSPVVIQQRKDEFGGERGVGKSLDGALQSLVDRDFDTLFSREPEINQVTGMKAHFREQVYQYYLRTGDAEQAKRLAWNDMRRVWDVSEVNGSKQMMLMPPEKFGVHPAEVRTALDELGPGLTIVPDALTQRQMNSLIDGKSVQPTYSIMNADGTLYVDDRGIRKRFAVPGGDEMVRRITEAQAKAKAEAARQIEDAKARREQIQQHRMLQMLGK